MLITICDLETTGLDPENDRAIEIGGILYSTAHRSIVAQYSTLLPVLVNPIEDITGINAGVTNLIPPNIVPIQNFFSMSEYVTGHNFKSFDKNFFGKNGLPELTLPIIDTMSDVKFPKGKYHGSRIRALDRLALDHRIPVWDNHRALSDCKLLADIFSCYSEAELKKIFEAALEPRILYISLEMKPGTLSKAAGFSWNGIVPRKWAAYLTEKEAQSLSFNVVKASPVNQG